VDNDGHTVERAMHGPDEPYNDISRGDWTRAPALFGGPDVPVTRATTAGELRAALGAAQARPDGFSLVQAVVPRDDVPELLASLVRVLAATNAEGHLTDHFRSITIRFRRPRASPRWRSVTARVVARPAVEASGKASCRGREPVSGDA
jgi:hypothetical protein